MVGVPERHSRHRISEEVAVPHTRGGDFDVHSLDHSSHPWEVDDLGNARDIPEGSSSEEEGVGRIHQQDHNDLAEDFSADSFASRVSRLGSTLKISGGSDKQMR